MSVAVRFAPSPTGRLHVGNARMALINWLFARAHGGRFILRYDDTDLVRAEPVYSLAVPKDLRWLRLVWAKSDQRKQSDHLSDYTDAAKQLTKSGRVYACYETREELALKRRALLDRRQPPVYNRAALKLTTADRARLEKQGRKPHFRFKLDHRLVEWIDLVRGPVVFDAADLSDPVLIREDGVPLYNLASVVDDISCGITHVIRGEDHVTNTVSQIQLFEALGSTPPIFAHLALLVGAGGESLSKRLRSLSLEALRADGIEPMAVNSLLARLGTSKPVEPFQSLWEIVESFDIEDFGRAPARFDLEELKSLSARILHEMPYALHADRPYPDRMETAEERLRELGLDGIDERFWLAVRPNLGRLEDAREWSQVCRGPVAPVIEDSGFARKAAELLPEAPWDETTFGAWAGALEAATGRKGKELIRPLRLALTGREHGPELKYLLPIIGRERAVARLAGKTA